MTKPFRTTAEIPLIMGKPETTNTMKHKHMGEYSWEEPDAYFNEHGDVIEHTAVREVPWDLCKQIYRDMAQTAIREQALRELTKLAQENGEYE